MNKQEFFKLLDQQRFSKDEVNHLEKWLLEYKAIKLDRLPAGVYVQHNHNDPDGEQNDHELMYTIHYKKLGYGNPIGALLGDIKLLFKPLTVTQSMKLVTGLRVGDLKAEAQKIWPSARPITRDEWVKLSSKIDVYNDLREVMKKYPIALPAIDDHVFCLHMNDNNTPFVTRVDLHTGDMIMTPATDIDYILCTF